MKRRPFYVLLAVFLLLAIVSAVLGTGSSLDLIVLPFSLTAALLRTLSLSGTLGNIAAILLFVLLGLLPLLFKIKRKWRKEDLMLLLCSMTIWYALYYMINPALRPGTLGGDVGEFILAGTVYSVLILWAVIKLMDHCKKADTAAIYRALEIFLLICAAERACAVVTRFFGSFASIETVKAANTMPGLDLAPTYLFLFLGFAVAAIEYILNASAFYLGAKLVSQLRLDPYSSASAAASAKATALCRRALIIITATNLALNLSQVLFASHIHSLAAQFHFPVQSIAVVFALLVLSSLLAQGKELKEDNDLFI